MRKSAAEVIRGLEARVARLERAQRGRRDPLMVISEKIARKGKEMKLSKYSVRYEFDRRKMGDGQVMLIIQYKMLVDTEKARDEVGAVYMYAEDLLEKKYGLNNYDVHDWTKTAISFLIDER